ncbi:MAG: HAD-IA family hydrolase [Dehalococcoidia bacterium]|nr:HAD-IA family hydrolase [Dehalococcoidia bacterium]
MRAVLWDMDDTLLHTLPVRMRALSHAYEQCVGGSVDPEALWRSHRGGSLEAMGKRLLGEADYMRFVNAYRDFYYEQDRRIEAFPGVVAVLEAFEAAEVPMAVVTSKIAFGAVDELTSSGLLRFFHSVVGADDTDAHKPDPAPVYQALDRLLIEPGPDVLMVGDSPADILAARNASVRSVAALWGTLDSELLLDTMPDHTARTPADVLALFTELAAPE